MNTKEPLGLPKGSVRALIALMLVITFCVTGAVTKIIPQELITLVGVIVGFYFGSKAVTAK